MPRPNLDKALVGFNYVRQHWKNLGKLNFNFTRVVHLEKEFSVLQPVQGR